MASAVENALPPILEKMKIYVDEGLPNSKRRALIARLQAFRAVITPIEEADHVVLATATHLPQGDIHRIRSVDWIEEVIKSKLKNQYERYINTSLNTMNRSLSHPEVPNTRSDPRREKQKKLGSTRYGSSHSSTSKSEPRPSLSASESEAHEEQEKQKGTRRKRQLSDDSYKPSSGTINPTLSNTSNPINGHDHSDEASDGIPGRTKMGPIAKQILDKAAKTKEIEISGGTVFIFKRDDPSIAKKSRYDRPLRLPTPPFIRAKRETLRVTQKIIGEALKVQEEYRGSKASGDVATSSQENVEQSPPQNEKHMGFASWRRRPEVIVPDSDLSQNTGTGAEGSNKSSTARTTVHIPQALEANLTQGCPKNTQSDACAIQPQEDSQSWHQSQVSRLSIFDSIRPSQKASQEDTNDVYFDRSWLEFDMGELEEPCTSDSEDYEPGDISLDVDDDDSSVWGSCLEGFSDSDDEDKALSSYPATGTFLSGTPISERQERMVRPLNPSISSYAPRYFKQALKGYYAKNQTQSTTFSSQSTMPNSQIINHFLASQPTHLILAQVPPFIRRRQRQLVKAVLSFTSLWLGLPTKSVKEVWTSIPMQSRTFSMLQRCCLAFNVNKPAYSSRGSGPSRKRRKLAAEQTSTKPSEDGNDSYNRSKYSPRHYGDISDDDRDSEDKSDDQHSLPAKRRRPPLWPEGVKKYLPYPSQPSPEWEKKICCMLAALYGTSHPSKVRKIWMEKNGDINEVENELKARSNSQIKTSDPARSYSNQDLVTVGLGDIPRPWISS